MMQLAKGLRVPPELSATLAAELQRLKLFLWHGNGFRSLQTVDDITTDLEAVFGLLRLRRAHRCNNEGRDIFPFGVQEMARRYRVP